MMPGGHLVTAAALGGIAYATTGSTELAAGCFAGGFLIDLDHYFDYLVFEGQWRKQIRFKTAKAVFLLDIIGVKPNYGKG